MVLERREFLQILYDQLPDKSYIKTSSGVKDIKNIPGGVEVTLTNGDVERGDIVLGADGVYSMVRSVMWEQANKATPGLITVQEKTSEYVCFTLHSRPPLFHSAPKREVPLLNTRMSHLPRYQDTMEVTDRRDPQHPRAWRSGCHRRQRHGAFLVGARAAR